MYFLAKLIIQWGQFAPIGNSYKTFTLPTSFSDPSYSACATRAWDTHSDTNTFFINIGTRTINTIQLLASAAGTHGSLLIGIGY